MTNDVRCALQVACEKLGELLRKAGLPEATRLTRCRISRYRVFKWKE